MNKGDWVIIQNQTGDREWLNGTVGQITKVCREGLFYEVAARGMSFGFHKESVRPKDGEVRETVAVEDRSGMGWDDIAGQLYFDLGEHVEECHESERMIWEWVKQAYENGYREGHYKATADLAIALTLEEEG